MTDSVKNNSKQLRDIMVELPISQLQGLASSKLELWKALYHSLNYYILPEANCKMVYLRMVLNEEIK